MGVAVSLNSVKDNTLNLSVNMNKTVKTVDNINKPGSGCKSCEDVPKLLAIGYEIGVGVTKCVADNMDTNTLISNKPCSEQAESKLCSNIDIGPAKNFTKLFEIF